MRLNQYIALASPLSRRAADEAIREGRVRLNDRPARLGDQVTDGDVVALDDQLLSLPQEQQTIILNKPVGFVCSRRGQGSQTIYDLLPKELHHLNPVGRLDKDSSGLLLLTNDGELAHQLTHPSFKKAKVYEVKLNRVLTPADAAQITRDGVKLDDGLSSFQLHQLGKDSWQVTMSEGRNRQIRRTFEALGYQVTELHRTQLGSYKLNRLELGKYKVQL